MSLITRMLKEVCVYWAPGDAGPDGLPMALPPIQIKCRWEDLAVEFIDMKDVKTVSRSRVYVDRDVKIGGILWFGKLKDLDSQTNPFKNYGAFRIRQFAKIPNIRITEFVRQAFL